MEGFTTLTINGHPFRADFGGFPMVVSLQFCFFIIESPGIKIMGKRFFYVV
jgi:hypothetical protein